MMFGSFIALMIDVRLTKTTCFRLHHSMLKRIEQDQPPLPMLQSSLIQIPTVFLWHTGNFFILAFSFHTSYLRRWERIY